ncbi:hypothetical protein AB4Y96_00410 [Phyllobacterium sp. TAF24]|uniref:hypothetical protein n=1 Tax=unclassified Phyllobacterium TaxID=2638441 RepID=UPI00088472FA|nr:hypothetical protein [Phyllobacterium sp. OV277]SDP15245.1 hypothetical protein SAMN05443582_103540 [Phyllobacterium sp. OV277]
MFRRLLALTAAALLAPVIAHAGDSIMLKGPSARPNSVSYIGYDSFDVDGNPVCTPCIEQKAAEAAKLKAYLERRERSRQYMARLQGNGPKPDALVAAANAATLPPETAVPATQTPASPIADIGATPLRASIQ